jgi:hypothetical protein
MLSRRNPEEQANSKSKEKKGWVLLPIPLFCVLSRFPGLLALGRVGYYPNPIRRF